MYRVVVEPGHSTVLKHSIFLWGSLRLPAAHAIIRDDRAFEIYTHAYHIQLKHSDQTFEH